MMKNSFNPFSKKRDLSFFKKGTAEDFLRNGNFQEAAGFLFATAQFFGIMPVIGVKSKSASNLRFTWKSFRFFYTIFIMICMSIVTGLVIYWTLNYRLEFGKMTKLIFFTSNLYAVVQFLFLAKKWPTVMMKWEKTESNLPPIRTQVEKQLLSYQIKMMTLLVVISSLTEHLLSIIVGLNDANNCPAIKDPIQAYFTKTFPQLFYFLDNKYNGPLSMIFQIIESMTTFIWMYNDLFVIVISMGLTFRFKQINNELMEAKGKVMTSNYWSEHRLYHRSMCELIIHVDSAVSVMNMLSISNNLFFICVQLLNSLDKKETFAHTFYFWFSLTCLIIRTLVISLYTAAVNDESKRPLEVFRTITKEGWCLEAKRFCEEVTNDIVALTGMNFFNLTRRLVLSVAGTIVTYELVLIQFHTDSEITDYDPCMRKNETATKLVFGG